MYKKNRSEITVEAVMIIHVHTLCTHTGRIAGEMVKDRCNKTVKMFTFYSSSIDVRFLVDFHNLGNCYGKIYNIKVICANVRAINIHVSMIQQPKRSDVQNVDM